MTPSGCCVTCSTRAGCTSRDDLSRMTPRAAAGPALTRALTLRDLVLFNIVAVLSIRWLATSAGAGPSSLVLWVLAGIRLIAWDGEPAWKV